MTRTPLFIITTTVCTLLQETWCRKRRRRTYLILSRGLESGKSVTDSVNSPQPHGKPPSPHPDQVVQDISNSSLRDVEKGALEAELSAYMAEVTKSRFS